ncbi:MAG: glutamate--tRNA ligase [Candidatus Aenigmatarchaeota archaeon]|nr:glutamate--tRNA ligase [Candidatus Aenigmarchaeota archaeon]
MIYFLIDMGIKEIAFKHALINAIEFNGKCSFQAVLSKVLGENQEFKKDMKTTVSLVKEIVEKVNKMSLSEQKKEFEKLGIKIEKKDEKKDLPELPEAQNGKVITAFPPEPSKYPHLGHAKAALINYMYAKKYNGKFFLRFEDTNPTLAKKEYYQAIINGLKWLGIEWDKIDYISDHIEEYYKYTEKLIKDGKAYVCLCQQDQIKKNRANGIECEHRSASTKENLNLWKDMFNFNQGEATVRLKIDMNHVNTTMRDPSIIRIIDKEHVRTGKKYKLWPTYDFGTAVMDGLQQVTHRVRSKEFEMRTELQHYIQDLLGFKRTFITEIARFNLEGVPSSGRIIREMIAKNELLGWDDPRLTTLMALKRRGFLPEAIKEFLISTGISKAESTLTWDVLESFNRKHLDKIANRYFAVFDPVKIQLNVEKTVEEPLHPEFPERGKRILKVSKEVYISRSDYEKFFGKTVRLIGLFNVKLSDRPEYAGNTIEQNMPKIHWVPGENVKISIVMNDGSTREMIAENGIESVKENEFVQFMRVGFARLDDKKRMLFYFTHN